MKKVMIVLLILMYSTIAFSQQDILSGIWKYQNNNEVFIVNIWKVADGYKGHYKKIIVDANGNQVSVVYNSNKGIGDTGHNWPFAIGTGDMTIDCKIGGTIYDNTVVNTPNAGGFIDGKVTIQVLNSGCYNPTGNTCTLQAQWKVKKMPGLKHPDEPDFNIPTNIILTKQ
ncbi:hypothetical protein FYC62_12910 [Pedobacter aquae]|uniref:DUF2147 domain-containing protein n=1 Tax=Pedobacter aquae TaxID=2605747 RepID=A0A5C0VKQ8_9SPHI|nr:hypothetical protein [Pedobacter aquae]QEK52452.1 hypothetical protein FYC62_12910 [Pedobacter aquae]